MEDILVLFCGIVFGVLLGWNLRERFAQHVVNKILEENNLLKEENQEENPNVIRMHLEKHSDVIYAFVEEDDSFIAQGKTLKELDIAIRARFPNDKFSVREDNLKSLGVNYDTV